MPTRRDMDGLVNDYLEDGRTAQLTGRAAATWDQSFGQTIRGNARPSDQRNPGPQLPANLRDDAQFDVHQVRSGYGFTLTAFATENTTDYVKGWELFESGRYREGAWEIVNVNR